MLQFSSGGLALRPNELRVVMEAEARRLRAQYTATGHRAEPSVIAALVLEACQALPHVGGRMELLWRYVEDYVRGLDESTALKDV
jgi:hypothetical protein